MRVEIVFGMRREEERYLPLWQFHWFLRKYSLFTMPNRDQNQVKCIIEELQLEQRCNRLNVGTTQNPSFRTISHTSHLPSQSRRVSLKMHLVSEIFLFEKSSVSSVPVQRTKNYAAELYRVSFVAGKERMILNAKTLLKSLRDTTAMVKVFQLMLSSVTKMV